MAHREISRFTYITKCFQAQSHKIGWVSGWWLFVNNYTGAQISEHTPEYVMYSEWHWSMWYYLRKGSRCYWRQLPEDTEQKQHCAVMVSVTSVLIGSPWANHFFCAWHPHPAVGVWFKNFTHALRLAPKGKKWELHKPQAQLSLENPPYTISNILQWSTFPLNKFVFCKQFWKNFYHSLLIIKIMYVKLI